MVVWCINVYVNANFTQWEFKHLNSLKAFPNMKMERAFAKINVFVCMYVCCIKHKYSTVPIPRSCTYLIAVSMRHLPPLVSFSTLKQFFPILKSFFNSRKSSLSIRIFQHCNIPVNTPRFPELKEDIHWNENLWGET